MFSFYFFFFFFFFYNTDIDDTAITEVQVLNEVLERQNFGLCLSVAGMSVLQDQVANAAREDKFLVSGLKQSGQPAENLSAQRSAGHAVMTSLLAAVFPGNDCPSILEVSVVVGRYVPSPVLPTLLFAFNSPQIAKEVRFRLLKHVRTSPALERIFIEPSFNRST